MSFATGVMIFLAVDFVFVLISNVEGLAVLASAMMVDDCASSTALLSRSTLEIFHSEPVERDIFPSIPSHFVKGGVALTRSPTVPTAQPLPPKFTCEGLEGE